MHITYLIIAMVLNAGANVLLKISARTSATAQPSTFLEYAHTYKFFILGAFLFACNIIFYFLAMRMLPISVAYPVMIGGGFLIVNTIAIFFLHESVSALQIIGYLCIILGIVLVVSYTQ